MPELPITALYAGIAGIVFVVLSARVIALRFKHKVGIGDDAHKDLQVRIRIHANFAEFAPIALILLAVNEMNGAPGYLIHAHGALLVAARLAHAVGMTISTGPTAARMFGMIGTFWVILATSAGAIWPWLGGGW
jgi:uncharacterized membrane protein YecN with MAPEG domain